MPGSRLPEDGSGAMPRKVAELLRADENVHASLSRVSSLVRSRGLNARVLERIIVGSPDGSPLTLKILGRGQCDEAPSSAARLSDALAASDLTKTWRAALVAAYIDFVHTTVSKTGLLTDRVWGTAWATAEMAHWVARKHVVDPEEAFVAGLLLDIGLVALVYALPEVYSAYASSTDNRPVEIFELESFGFDHTSVGVAVLRAFKFPDSTADIVASHHDPQRSLSMEGKVLRAAAVATESGGADFGLAKPAPSLDKATLEGALLKPEQAEHIQGVARGYWEAALRFKATIGSWAA